MLNIGSLCTRPPVTCEPNTDVRSVAQLMRQHHVGCVVVTSANHNGARPLGIVTDRDLVLGVLAADVAIETVTVGDVMTTDLVTVAEHDSIIDTLRRMHECGAKRMPVTNARGGLVGVVSADDLLEYFLVPFGDLAAIMVRERDRETERRPAWNSRP